MVVASELLVKVTRGGRKPLLVEVTSNFAEASGVVVPMPVWANKPVDKNKKRINLFIINTLNR
jgi:hypothetical protein